MHRLEYAQNRLGVRPAPQANVQHKAGQGHTAEETEGTHTHERETGQKETQTNATRRARTHLGALGGGGVEVFRDAVHAGGQRHVVALGGAQVQLQTTPAVHQPRAQGVRSKEEGHEGDSFAQTREQTRETEQEGCTWRGRTMRSCLSTSCRYSFQ